MPRKLLMPLLALGLAFAGLTAGTGVSRADPVPGDAVFGAVDQRPDQLIFDPDTDPAPLTLIQHVTDQKQWSVDAADAFVCVPREGNGYCDTPADFSLNTDWLAWDGKDSQQGQARTLTFTGKIPNSVRSFYYYFQVTYDVDPDPAKDVQRSFTSYYQNQYGYYFASVQGQGRTKVTIDGPGSIPTGSALRLTGRLQCYGPVGYKAPDYGGVEVQYRLPGAAPDDWNWVSGDFNYDPSSGAWSFTVPAWGTTADWRAIGYGYSGNYTCSYGDSATSAVITVVAGTEPPPPPPDVPDAPGLTVTGVTATTATLDWSVPDDNGSDITGYRIGWTSDSGLPQPSWSQVLASPEDPFVMTNLAPDSDYTMFIEALTAVGPGARATVRVHTSAASPAPVAHVPGKVRKLKGKPGSHKAVLTWKTPKKTNGKILQYCVHVNGIDDDKCVKGSKLRMVVKHLKVATYTLAVRARNADGFGPFSKPVKVRPHR